MTRGTNNGPRYSHSLSGLWEEGTGRIRAAGSSHPSARSSRRICLMNSRIAHLRTVGRGMIPHTIEIRCGTWPTWPMCQDVSTWRLCLLRKTVDHVICLLRTESSRAVRVKGAFLHAASAADVAEVALTPWPDNLPSSASPGDTLPFVSSSSHPKVTPNPN